MVVRIAGIRLSPQKQARSVKSGFGPPQPIQRRNLRGSGVSLWAQEDRAGTELSDVSFGFQTIRMGRMGLHNARRRSERRRSEAALQNAAAGAARRDAPDGAAARS